MTRWSHGICSIWPCFLLSVVTVELFVSVKCRLDGVGSVVVSRILGWCRCSAPGPSWTKLDRSSALSWSPLIRVPLRIVARLLDGDPSADLKTVTKTASNPHNTKRYEPAIFTSHGTKNEPAHSACHSQSQSPLPQPNASQVLHHQRQSVVVRRERAESE